jgi:drug/metabolite transporter (DMT)-like permease
MSIIIIIGNFGPIFVFLFNALLFKMPITIKEVFGAIIGFLGLVLVLDPNLFTGADAKKSLQFTYAEGIERFLCIALTLFVTIIWAYSIIMVKQMNGKVSAIQLTLY